MTHINFKDMPNGVWWIPSLYFGEALPYVAVMTISTMMYARLGLSNTEIALYTSLLYLPWVLKPIWSPVIDLMKSKRWWILCTEILITLSIAGVALHINRPSYLFFSLLYFWLMAFSSATHDIAADGFYMLALSNHEQALFVGLRSTFYRIATIVGSGALIILAGTLETFTRQIALSWSIAFYVLAAFFAIITAYHFWILPRPNTDRPHTGVTITRLAKEWCMTVVDFITKPHIVTAILFMLLYRLPEALLVKISNLFLIAPVSEGGLGLRYGASPCPTWCTCTSVTSSRRACGSSARWCAWSSLAMASGLRPTCYTLYIYRRASSRPRTTLSAPPSWHCP